jgi:hypothetical protein
MDAELRQLPVPSKSPVYHYTNVHGLKGIVESDALWLTDRVHLNDPTELAYGLKFALEWCDTHLDNEPPVVRLFFTQFRRGLDQVLDGIAAYVSSFCLRGDILSQNGVATRMTVTGSALSSPQDSSTRNGPRTLTRGGSSPI